MEWVKESQSMFEGSTGVVLNSTITRALVSCRRFGRMLLVLPSQRMIVAWDGAWSSTYQLQYVHPDGICDTGTP